MSEDVQTWLVQIGLDEYATLFLDNKISFDILPELTEADLEKLDIPLGHRKQFMVAIRQLIASSGQTAASSIIASVSASANRESIKPERRQLTVMFCDMVGSTALSEHLDPETIGEMFASYRDTCEKVIKDNLGKTARYLGDGILVYFGYPEAHEDDPERAVRTGLGIVKALAARSHGVAAAAGIQMTVRIGIATGNVVAGDMVGRDTSERDAVVGEAPNLAERLMKLAEPGTVVIAESTQRLVAGLFDCVKTGEHQLKGFSQKSPVWRVIKESDLKSRSQALHARSGFTKLVGREDELGLLRRQWQNAQRGDGNVVLISGEPGIGKSRLAWSLRNELKQMEQPPTVLRYFCSPQYRNTALYPIINQIARAAHIDPLNTPEDKLDKLEAMLAPGTSEVAATLDILADLLSIPSQSGDPELTRAPQSHKQKTMDVLEGQLVEIARQGPVLVIIEDLHWSDPTTWELIGRVIKRVSQLSMLMLITYRPEIIPPWSSEHYVTTLIMNRLSPVVSKALVESLAGGKPLPFQVVEQIVDETDGNPLFIEEVFKTLVTGGFLSDEGDRYALKDPSASLSVPSSLAGLLMARLDRLGEAKQVAQVAAALGRQFHYSLIAAVLPLDGAQVREALDQLVQFEIIYGRGQQEQDPLYLFKHALLQDAAHASLLHSERKQLHARIAEIMEKDYPERVESEPELLAQHYTFAEIYDRAIDFWRRSGSRASQRLGYTAPEVVASYSRARELCEQQGYGSKESKSKIFPAIRGLWVYHFIRADLDDAHTLGDQLLQLSTDMAKDEESTKDEDFSGYFTEAHRSIGMTEFYQGQFTSSHRHLEQATKLYDPERHRSHMRSYGVDPGVISESYYAIALWFLGYPDQALRQSEATLRVTRQLEHPFSQANSLSFAVYLRQHMRDEHATRELADEVIALSQEHGFPFWENQQKILRGWALSELGEASDGLAQMKEGLDYYEAVGSRLAGTWYLGIFANTAAKCGLQHECQKAMEDAFAMMEVTGERFYLAELHRLRGEIMLIRQGLDAATEVEACYRQSLETAQAQRAKSWELRTSVSLAKLLRDLKRPEEALEPLERIYSSYTEGFETKDLRTASATLEELKSGA